MTSEANCSDVRGDKWLAQTLLALKRIYHSRFIAIYSPADSNNVGLQVYDRWDPSLLMRGNRGIIFRPVYTVQSNVRDVGGSDKVASVVMDGHGRAIGYLPLGQLDYATTRSLVGTLLTQYCSDWHSYQEDGDCCIVAIDSLSTTTLLLKNTENIQLP